LKPGPLERGLLALQKNGILSKNARCDHQTDQKDNAVAQVILGDGWCAIVT